MPRINTRFAAGLLDELVYRAAEAAGMPELVVSRYDGAGFVWEWMISPWSAAEVSSVVFRVRPRAGGGFMAEVGVVTSLPSPTPRASAWHAIGQTTAASLPALDETWLTQQLRTGRDLAAQPSGAKARTRT
jgi:hypothetical protein